MSEITAKKNVKMRVHNWIDIDTMQPKFGVQANVAYGKWVHVINGSSLVLFDDRKDASAFIASHRTAVEL